MKHIIFYGVSAMAIFIVLSGCINLGPDYTPPDLGIQTPESYEYAPTGTGLAVGGDRWWEVFGDSELSLLVDEVLKHNWDIKQAAARVLEARAFYVQVRSDRFPSVGISGSKDRRQISGGGRGSATIVDTYDLRRRRPSSWISGAGWPKLPELPGRIFCKRKRFVKRMLSKDTGKEKAG